MSLAVEPVCVATVLGHPYTTIPADLFIPPDALEVLLDSFTGPLDLLLYLIRRQNIDIMDIPILTITRQYMAYIELMEQRRLELAADYLVMAAMLAEIKSRLLLPPLPTAHDEAIEEDPRMALVRRLQLYEQVKNAAMQLDLLIRCERDVFPVKIEPAPFERLKPIPEVTLEALVQAMSQLMRNQVRTESHAVQREQLSVRERMAFVLTCLQRESVLDFSALYTQAEGRMGLVVSLLAILELAKQSLLTITQVALYAPIALKAGNNA